MLFIIWNFQRLFCDSNTVSTFAGYDHDSTPSTMKSIIVTDDTMNDSGLSKSVSSSDSQKTSFGDFHSWDEVFEHLKREMAYMRQRDAKIFADLHFVELQLRSVRNRALAASKSDYAVMASSNNNNTILDKRQIKLGELVESMPL
ncbi:unnamed protein product [Gongylonema pulchrum]|uniref:GTD-binding domain-containing protein n=1 Tax=Gongylonema pulchrum TaxID=637853 RepID=A0A183DPY9_9BILA|nr:unnamed protein product [Gongylonema pulchrum]